jgi:hypothetical protein
MKVDYLSQSGGRIRLKVVHVRESGFDAYISPEELAPYPGLCRVLEESRQKASVQTYPQPFEALNPTPLTVEVGAGEAENLAKLLETRSRINPYERAVKVRVGQHTYIIAFEHHCG